MCRGQRRSSKSHCKRGFGLVTSTGARLCQVQLCLGTTAASIKNCQTSRTPSVTVTAQATNNPVRQAPLTHHLQI